MTTDITNNSQYITGKPRESVTLKSIIDGINDLIQSELINFAEDTEKQISILTATGVWLDWIGARLNFPRPTLAQDDFEVFGFDGHGVGFDQAPFWDGSDYGIGVTDETYRKFLIARGGQLLTDGSIASMTAVLVAAFGDGNYYVDNGDMTLDVIIDPDMDDVVMGIVQTTDLLTKPAGVRFRLISRVVRGLLSIGIIDNIDLIQKHTLIVQEALSAGTIDNLALNQTITVAEALSTGSIDNLTLTQKHTLVMHDALSAGTIDNLDLTQKHTLVVQEALSTGTIDNITLVMP